MKFGKQQIRELIAEKIKRVNDYQVGPQHIAITMGGTGAIQLALTSLCYHPSR